MPTERTQHFRVDLQKISNANNVSHTRKKVRKKPCLGLMPESTKLSLF
jgi:hypothetical protein